MTMPSGRKVVVGDQAYRFTVSERSINAKGDLLRVYVEEEGGRGSLLRVEVWKTHCPSITPDIVKRFVTAGLQAGWKPNGRGSFDLKEPEQYLE